MLKAVRALPLEDPHAGAVRGQYAAGSVGGETLCGYRREPGVEAQSATETYAALKLYIDNWRWHGVPFYLRTGKRMPRKLSQVVICFRPVPHRMFPVHASDNFEANRLVIGIQPAEEIVLEFQAKAPVLCGENPCGGHSGDLRGRPHGFRQGHAGGGTGQTAGLPLSGLRLV